MVSNVRHVTPARLNLMCRRAGFFFQEAMEKMARIGKVVRPNLELER